ncbi:antitoxin Xre/MbcA/ParS toxin-binding domain-containing protein, partial [Falsiroseomonas sp. E2-1-a20]|uniref:antitoxin Xre/MbcA/ParS toxin-binding domain-containing protein n=1 Tax=Falsiroseomonas sp. E2-1-a20 TaxID=3239300 RepID=UPI003F3AA235
MPAGTKPTDRPDDALLAEVAEALDQTASSHRAGASRAACAAAVLRGDAAPVGGEAARARFAHLALRMLAQSEVAARPDWVAPFLWQQHGHLEGAPLDLVRTVAGAEQVRRLVEREPPLGRPDPARVAAAAQLDDLTAEEA